MKQEKLDQDGDDHFDIEMQIGDEADRETNEENPPQRYLYVALRYRAARWDREIDALKRSQRRAVRDVVDNFADRE